MKSFVSVHCFHTVDVDNTVIVAISGTKGLPDIVIFRILKRYT
jgi:hypothetical protein